MLAKSIAKLAGDHNTALAEHVTAIRQLGKATITNIVEIGRHLTECKRKVGTRDWGCWLSRELGWSERAGANFMSLFELSNSKSANFAEIDLPVSALYLLAAPSTPQPVRDEILERAEAGEKMTVAEVKETIAAAAPSSKRSDTKGRVARKATTRPSELVVIDASGKNRKKISSKEARALLTIDTLRDANARQMDLINKFQNEKREAAAQRQQDIEPASSGEFGRLQSRNAELENENHMLRSKVLSLEAEIEDLRKAAPVGDDLDIPAFLDRTRRQHRGEVK